MHVSEALSPEYPITIPKSQGRPSNQNDHKKEEAKTKNSHIMILKHTSKVQSVIRVVEPDKTKITKGPETDPGTCGQIVCDKGSITIEWGTRRFNKWSQENGMVIGERVNVSPNLTSTAKIIERDMTPNWKTLRRACRD